MYLKHIYDKTLSQSSYIIGCQQKGICAVIDAKRDIDDYLEIAEKEGFKITHILETHIHADFLCGSRELSKITGAKMYLSDEGGENWQYDFKHEGLKDGDKIELGNLTFQALHTPGHTPEHMSFLLTDNPASKEPVMIFTGDFVFVGDVGRPDLLETAAGQIGTKEIGAEQMFYSLQKFMELDDGILLFPGHGAGSACGKKLGAVNVSTVGYEKKRNWAFQLLDDKDAFIHEILSEQPEPPKYFTMMKKLNKEKRKVLTTIPKIQNLNQVEWDELKYKIQVIDTRKDTEYAKRHFRGSFNIMNNNSFATWMGWVMRYDSDFILIIKKEELEDATRKLLRIGLDNLKGFITPEQLFSYEKDLDNYPIIHKEKIKENISKYHILDVRNHKEFRAGHIEQAQHIFIGELLNRLEEIPKNKPIVVHCQSGVRSTLAVSILESKGYLDLYNYAGGWRDWVK